jgi:hypothetical protein
MENRDEPREATLGFRCTVSMSHMVRAAAAKQGVLVSDWLRRATARVLQSEFLGRAAHIESNPGTDTSEDLET